MKRFRRARIVVLLMLVTTLVCSSWMVSVAQVGPQRERPSYALAAANQQPPGQPVERKLAPTQLTPNTIRVNSRAPIAFQPFPMVDPKARKQVSPDYILTLPDGKKVKAGDYYAELNRVEQALNRLGYSLRTMPDKTVLQESIIDRSTLQPRAFTRRMATGISPRPQLARRFSEGHTLQSGRRVLMADELTPQAVSAARAQLRQQTVAVMDNAVRVVPADRPPIAVLAGSSASAPPKTFHREQPWDWSVGSPSSFQAYLKGKFVTDAKVYAMKDPSNTELAKSNTDFTVSANAEAGGAILGKAADLVRANASFYAPANVAKPLNVKMGVSVLGATVYSFNKNFPAKWSASDTLSYTLKVGVPFGVPLGPVVVGGEVGAKGSAGFQYGITLFRAGVYGHVDPFVHTAVYGEGGASILIGGAGVGVEMTLLNADLQLYGKATLGWLIKWMIFDELYCDYKLDMLSGRVYAYAYVWYPCDWIGPIPTDVCKKQWEHNFWKWAGFKDDGVLIDHKNIIAFDKW